MTRVQEEIDAKRAAAEAELDKTLKERAAAEGALKDAHDSVRERQEALQVILEKEGKLRGAIGELDRARNALEDAPD